MHGCACVDVAKIGIMESSEQSFLCGLRKGPASDSGKKECYMKRLFDIDPWKIKTTVLNIEEKRLQERLTAIGNGYMRMRENFEEGYSGYTHEGTYLNGVWYPDKTLVKCWTNRDQA